MKSSISVPSLTVPCLFQISTPDYSSINANLVNYWTFNNNFDDIISGYNLYNATNVAFTTDRLNNPNSAVFLNLGYLAAPAGVYFNGDFTLSFWAKFYNLVSSSGAKILDFNLSMRFLFFFAMFITLSSH